MQALLVKLAVGQYSPADRARVKPAVMKLLSLYLQERCVESASSEIWFNTLVYSDEEIMMQLYSFEESGNSYKVRLLLSFLKLDYQRIDIDLMKDEQHQPAYLAVNPRGEVPALVDGELLLCDSAAIMLYLAARAGPRPWWSDRIEEQAHIMEWLAFAASWVQYGVFTARALLAFGISANGLPADYRGESVEAAQIRGRHSLDILDQHLRSREWLACARPTIGDIAVFPYIALAPMGDIPLEPYPAVQAWIARFQALPGFTPIPGLNDARYRRA
jgi:glutathione S-transferase